MHKRVLAVLLALPLLAACNPSLVKEGDPLYDYTGKEYYLARPLSGPKLRHPNIFGAQPRLDAGTKVTVEQIERSTPIYRVTFTGPDACGPTGCTTHWRHESDETFAAKFNRVFSEANPLDELGEDVRRLVEGHQVASQMTKEEVALALGEPNVWKETEAGQRWVYEERSCDNQARLVAVPRLALIFEGEQLADYEQLNVSEWYPTNEPVNKLSGICEGVQSLPEDTQIRPVESGDMGQTWEEPTPPGLNDPDARRDAPVE